ncbi:MAG: hypothetical protein EAZ97_12180 [Bacteroidetes bacterium]|nr:MAG: hypothetical protein EAZ97_12180 [Bacteroidota bacterium]
MNVKTILAQEKVNIFTGKVLEVGETGLGPLQFVSLKNDKGEEFSINFMPEDATFEMNKKYTISYHIVQKSLAVGIRLMSEPFNVAKHIDAGYKDNNLVKVQGKYISGEQGDMGKYVSIKDKKGKTLDFLGSFECDIDNAQKYKNKEVEIIYVLEQEKEFVSMKAVK